MDKVIENIEKCASLPANWNYDGSVPTKPEVTAAALELHAMASEFGLDGNAFPWPNGNITLCYYKYPGTEDVICAEIALYLVDGNIEMHLCVEQGYGDKFKTLHENEDASLEDIKNALYCMKNDMSEGWY